MICFKREYDNRAYQKIAGLLLPIVFLAVFFNPVCAQAQSDDGYELARMGLSLNTGYMYDPGDDIRFVQVSIFKLYDYDMIWKHDAPENLRFKIEGSVGGASMENSDARLIANTGIMALLYLDKFESDRYKPYLEAGIGIVFTDYRVDGQEYRFNFNPQAGIGCEFKRKENTSRFITLRLHHISNGGIGSSNRGQNSIGLMFGQFF